MINDRRIARASAAGFTIIELMIASTLFSVILLIIIFGVMRVSHTYIKGLVTSQTQETARSIMEQISQDIQLSGDTPTQLTGPMTTANYGGYCVGSHLYSYQLNSEVSSSVHGLLYNANVPGCTSTTSPDSMSAPPSSDKELLSSKMRVGQFSITQLSPNLWQISMTIAYGDAAVLQGTTASSPPYSYSCNAISQSGDFCDVVTFNTVVAQRISTGG